MCACPSHQVMRRLAGAHAHGLHDIKAKPKHVYRTRWLDHDKLKQCNQHEWL